MKRTIVIVAGLAAVLLLALLAGPALVDWSRYKEGIATRLERATGRDVDIAGPVGLRLLPSPAFSAAQVTIGNLPGAGDQPMAVVERLDIRLKLLPLLGGRIEVTSLVLDRPELHLVRLADGRANWQFTAPTDAPGGDAAPAQGRPTLKGEPPPEPEPDGGISIGQATIRDGVVTYRSGDDSPVRVEAIDARIAIAGTSGPFTAEGEARHAGLPIRFDVAVDRISAGRGSPVTFALSLPDSGARLDFAGMLSRLSGGESLRGKLTVAAPDAARALAPWGIAAPAAALGAEADLAATGDEVTADNLAVSLGDTRVTGTITAAFGEVPQLDADLRIAALDLDKLTAAPAKAKAPPAAAPGITRPADPAPSTPAARQGAEGFALPQRLFANLKLVAETVAWRGEVVRDARIEATLAEGELTLRRVAAQLPGGSALTGDGTLAAAHGRPAFDGTVRLVSNSPRALMAWLDAETEALPPGPLTLSTPVKLTWPELALPGFRIDLANKTARGRLSARLEQPLSFDLTADTSDWGAVTASGSYAKPALDARLQAFGLTATVKGIVGERTDLAVAARHPDAARLLRQLADYRPRGPLGALTASAQVTGGGNLWQVSGLGVEAGALRLTGSARAELGGARPRITAQLTGNDLALDPFLAAERTGYLLPGGPRLPPTMAPPPATILPAAALLAATGSAGDAPWSRDKLDLAALHSFDADVGLQAASVSAKGWRLDDADAKLVVRDGTAAVERLSGTLLGGTLDASARLAAGTVPALTGQVKIAGADVGAVKPGAGGIAVTQGRLDADARFATQGQSPHEMASRLAGDGRVLVKDGVITGFDLPAVNQRLSTIENVGSLLGLVQAGLTGGSTRFSQLAGTFQAKDGVISTRDLKLDAQGGGATAESATDLGRWTTATTIAFRLADSSAPPVLVRLEGPLGNPRKVIDINAVQQYLVARGLGRALKGKDGGLVDQLLGGKRQAPPEGQTGQAPDQQQPADKPNGARVLRDLLKGLGGR